MTLFSSLAPDEVFSIFRHISARPRSEKWLGYLPDDSANLLIDVRGPFAHHVNNLFVSLALGDSLCSMPDYLNISPFPSLSSSVFVRFGGSLQNIHVDEASILDSFGFNKGRKHITSIYSEIGRYCTNLKNFSVCHKCAAVDWVNVLANRCSSIEKLHVKYIQRPELCTVLPDTPLHELKVLCLENFCLNDVDDLVTFIKSSGGKLENIKINWAQGSRAEWSTIIDALRKSCRDVRKISLRAGPARVKKRGNWTRAGNIPEDDETRLYISYGAQLREAELLNVGITSCEQVFTRCPNVRCKWDPFDAIDCSFERFTLFAPRIIAIRLDTRLEWLNCSSKCERFEAALASLKYLNEFELGSLYRANACNCGRAIELAFANRHPFLEVISFAIPVVSRDIALLVTPSLCILRKLTLSVHEVQCDGIHRLFDACSNLQEAYFLTIEDYGNVQDALDFVGNLVNVAKKKISLRKLYIYIQAFFNIGWDDDKKKQFEERLPMTVQAMRLRRCLVDVCWKKFFE